MNSDIFRRALEKRSHEIRKDNPDASDEKIREGFIMTSKFKDLLWDFFEAGNRLEYNPDNHSQEFNDDLENIGILLEQEKSWLNIGQLKLKLAVKKE